MNWRHHFDRLEGAYASSTIKSYIRDFEAFAGWCRRKRLRALPASAQTVARFIDAQSRELKISSIKRKMCAIRKVHRLAGFNDIDEHETIALALRRAKRARPGRPRQALGVTFERRNALMGKCSDDLVGLRDKVMVAVGFDTLCRRAELVGLRVEDFQMSDAGTLTVLVRRAKNDQDGLGRIAHLSAETTHLVQHWLEMTGLERGPLLRPIYKGKIGARYLHPAAVGRVLKRLSGMAYDPEIAKKVSGHSLRVGSAQTLAKRGVGLLAIMSVGGWRSSNTVARYVENVEVNLWQ